MSDSDTFPPEIERVIAAMSEGEYLASERWIPPIGMWLTTLDKAVQGDKDAYAELLVHESAARRLFEIERDAPR